MPNRRTLLAPDTILLLALGTAHLWFNQVSSALFVILLALYVALDLAHPAMPDELPISNPRDRIVFSLRLLIVLFSVCFATILPTGLSVIRRLGEGPATNANDGLIQTEVAIQFLLEGRNPYAEDYSDTILGDWRGGEPPFTPIPGILLHNVYLPFLFIGSIPAHWLANATIGWYDQRLLYLLLFLVTLLLLADLMSSRRKQLMLMMLVGLNFLFVFHLAEGRNDVVILFGLVLTTVLLKRGHTNMAAVVFGMTLMAKHQAWFFLPFYLLYSWLSRPAEVRTLRSWAVSHWPLALTIAVIVGPFLVWSPTDFLADTVGYIIGASPFSFPIRGIGFSHLLVAFGLLPSHEASFPFSVLSLAFGLLALFYGLRLQWRENNLAHMWLGFAIFGFCFQFFSRFFNDNYFIFTVQAAFIAHFLYVEKRSPIELIES